MKITKSRKASESRDLNNTELRKSVIDNFLENTEEGYFETDLRGIFTYCNRAGADILGYSPEEIIESSYKEYMTDENAQKTYEIFHEVYKTTKPRLHFRYKFITKDGEQIFCNSSVYLRYDDQGNKTGFAGFMREETERVRMEKKLRKAEKILKNSKDAYFEVDLKGNFTYVNPAFSELLEYSTEELMGMNYREYMSEKAAHKVFEIYNKLYKTEKSHTSFQYGLITKSGKEIYCESSVYLRFDEEGKKIGFAGFVRDISSRHRFQQQLKQSEEKYRTIIENIKEGYFEVNRKGTVTFCNEAFCDIFGREKMIGVNYRNVMSKQKADEIFQIYNKVFKTEDPVVNLQHEFIDTHNRIIYCDSSVSLIYDDAGDPIGFRGLMRDVTEKVEAERKLKRSKQKYKDAFNRAEFYRDILAHDMSNILNSIKFSFELIEISVKGDKDEEELKELSEIIQRQIDRASSLISNIRRLSALEKENLEVKLVKINTILQKSIENVRNNYINGDIYIEFTPLEEEVEVNGGEFLLDAFENVLLNGIIHNKSEKKRMWINIDNIQENGTSYVKINFKDNGIGIPDKEKAKIFQREYKSKRTGGMGIGLSLVKRIIEGYGGRLRVNNRVSGDYTQGTEFVIMLQLNEDNKL